ncbi:MAG TPA: hypothetical protein GX691_05150 [Clostridia bacterium]|nr:hypothetical protein [Clostridia bacterium]
MELREALKLEVLQGSKVVAGRSGLNKQIKEVNIIDAPDIVNWAREGEFMLTTGYCFKDDENVGKQIIYDLAGKKCAGLGIKTKRFFENIPVNMIEFADKLSFPLIELPYYRTFSEISVSIYREILHKQASRLAHSMEINAGLTQIVLKGGGLESIADTLAGFIDRSISILDSHCHLLCGSLKSPMSEILKNLKRGHNFKALAEKDAFSEKESRRMTLKFGEEAFFTVWVTPVRAGEDLLGFIVVWEDDTNLSDLDISAVEQGAIVIALEQVKNRAVAETKHRLRDDFFDDLLSGKIESSAAVNNLGAIHGLDVSKQYVAMVIWVQNYAKLNLENIGIERENLRHITKKITKIVEDTSFQLGLPTVSAIRGNRVIVFLKVEPDMKNTIKRQSKEFANNLYKIISQDDSNIEVRIGIGKLRDSFLDIHKSFNEALHAIDMINKVGEVPVAHYDDFTIYNLLELAGGEAYIKELYENTVKKLEEYDINKQGDLVATLEAYLACGKNVSVASRELFIHRNTLIYRLQKIEEILNIDLNNHEEILNLVLGLKARKLLSPGNE